MDDVFQEKSMKLLADPLKMRKFQPKTETYDRLRSSVESTFEYKLTDESYQRIRSHIYQDLVLDSVMKDIINQVALRQNP